MQRAPLGRTSRLVSAIQVIIGGHVVAAGLATYWGNDTWYKRCVMPVVRTMLSAEASHMVAIKAAKYGLVPKMKHVDHPELKTHLWGLKFNTPVGLAAGFDKHGEAVDGLLRLGFSFIEVGSITPEPQEGNPKPRVFRLEKDRAIINRYGFNSDGHEVVAKRLEAREKERLGPEIPDDRNLLNENLWSPDRPKFQGHRHKEAGILGVNLGKNKTSDAARDYVAGVKKFGHLADYLVINISSPNTEGLRALQGKEELEKLLEKVIHARDELPGKKKTPLLVKLSPDLSQEDKADIAAVICKPRLKVDGLIISNTTLSRPPSLLSSEKQEIGGLSGPPVRDLATATTRDMYRLTGGQVPIIGVGGISCGRDAYDRIRAGASLIQLYTVMAYDGPPAIKRISDELAVLLREDGFKSVSEAVGVDAIKR